MSTFIQASAWTKADAPETDVLSIDNLFEHLFPDLTAHDRCDRCSARAVSQYMVEGTILMFCGHHTRALTSALEVYPSKVPDEHSYQYTAREDAARPRDNRARDAGSAPLDK